MDKSPQYKNRYEIDLKRTKVPIIGFNKPINIPNVNDNPIKNKNIGEFQLIFFLNLNRYSSEKIRRQFSRINGQYFLT